MPETTNAVPIPAPCPYCGMIHLPATCARVKAIEYYQEGSIKRVELHEPRPTIIGGQVALLPDMDRTIPTIR